MCVTRRDFLKTTAAGLTALLLPRPLVRKAFGAAGTPVLVVVYLRGGSDGLTICPPAGDPVYYDLRPTIQVPPGSELPLDGFFGLYPSFADLLPLYQSGALAIFHASGSPDPSRSHFDSQDFMERAAPGNKQILDGWLNRYLQAAGGGVALQGVTLANAKVKSMQGAAPSLAFASIADFVLTGESVAERRAALEARYELLQGTLLGGSVTDALAAVDVIGGVDTTTAVTYPAGELGPLLRDAAALVKADIGVKVVAVNLGGWDHHSDQLAHMDGLGAELGAALAAFHQDLGADAATTLTLCMTEFGRRPAENGAGGSDHGHGGVMFALGGGIAGGRVILRDGTWPGLAPGSLYNGQDLAVTTDFRDIFAEVLHKHMLLDVAAMGPVFPGFSVSEASFPGLLT
jgi:uncharacterized protein (DUF1501 family)